MVHAHDDRARSEEQQCLEEGVRHEVEHRNRVRRGAQGHRHVAKLGQRGIGNDPLDVVLDDAEETHEECRDGTYHQDQVQGGVTELEQRRHTGHHEDAGSDHGCRMDQGRDRGWTLHRIRQPDMQWKLRRLAHGTDEQADADDGDQHPVAAGEHRFRQFRGLGKDFGVVECAGEGEHQANTEDEPEITDPVHQERLHVGEDRSGPVEPETDQQVGHQPYGLPAEEQLQHIVAHHQHQHGKGEQGYIGEKTVVTVVVAHVADGVDVHHQRDEGHHAHHHRGQAVDQKTDLHFQATNLHPGVDGLIEARAVHGHAPQGLRRQDERQRYPGNGQGMAHAAPDAIAAKSRSKYTGKNSRHQRREGHSEQNRRGKGLTHCVAIRL